MRLAALVLLFCLIPNNEAAWLQDLGYDACRAMSGQDEWRCE